MEMESTVIPEQKHHKRHHHQQPLSLSPCNSGRRSSSASNSPEFEFWMLQNPVFPQPDLLSADELFVDGVLLPLDLLPLQHLPEPPDLNPAPEPEADPEQQVSEEKPRDPSSLLDPDPEMGPQLTPSTAPSTASKRWKDIFKKSDKKTNAATTANSNSVQEEKTSDKDRDREKKKEKKASGGGGAGSCSGAAELNINLWPFSRSRSAGNGGTRPRLVSGAPSGRKVSSAPCSRSNSAGDSKSRKWPSSPGRVGVHLGRSSPVWQVRRGAPVAKSPSGPTTSSSEPPAVRSLDKGVSSKNDVAGVESRRSKPARGGNSSGGNKARVLNLNVPMCIGYRHTLSCRSDDNSAVAIAAAAGGGGSSGGAGLAADNAGPGGSGSHIFNFRSLFTKKVH